MLPITTCLIQVQQESIGWTQPRIFVMCSGPAAAHELTIKVLWLILLCWYVLMALLEAVRLWE